MDSIRGWKTITANLLTVAAAGLGAVPPEWQQGALVASALINLALRFFTSTAAMKSS